MHGWAQHGEQCFRREQKVSVHVTGTLRPKNLTTEKLRSSCQHYVPLYLPQSSTINRPSKLLCPCWVHFAALKTTVVPDQPLLFSDKKMCGKKMGRPEQLDAWRCSKRNIVLLLKGVDLLRCQRAAMNAESIAET